MKYSAEPSVKSPVVNALISTSISFAFTVIPVPAPTFKIAVPDVAPPVKPAPAVTAVMSPLCPVIVIVLPLCVTVMPAEPWNVTRSLLDTSISPAVAVVNFHLL